MLTNDSVVATTNLHRLHALLLAASKIISALCQNQEDDYDLQQIKIAIYQATAQTRDYRRANTRGYVHY